MELQVGQPGDSTLNIKINKGRKVKTTKTVCGKPQSKQVMKLDKEEYRLFKAAVVKDALFYRLPSTINCESCLQGRMMIITVKTDHGTKTVSGINPADENSDVDSIVTLISNMVGNVGNELVSERAEEGH